MTYAEREEIFSKEALSITDMQILLGVGYGNSQKCREVSSLGSLFSLFWVKSESPKPGNADWLFRFFQVWEIKNGTLPFMETLRDFMPLWGRKKFVVYIKEPKSNESFGLGSFYYSLKRKTYFIIKINRRKRRISFLKILFGNKEQESFIRFWHFFCNRKGKPRIAFWRF